MSNKCMNHVWQNSKARGSARLVLLALADMANDDGECYPGKANLCAKCQMLPRNMLMTLNKLEAAGEIGIFHRRDGILNRTNLYKIYMEGDDQEIGRVAIRGSVGDDQGIGRGDDQGIGRGDDQGIARSLIFDPLEESLSDPESQTTRENAIQKMLRERRENGGRLQ